MTQWKATDSGLSHVASSNASGGIFSILPGMSNMRSAPSENDHQHSWVYSTASVQSMGALGSVTSTQMHEANKARREAFATEQAATKAFSDQDELRTRVRSSIDPGSLGHSSPTLLYKRNVWARIARSAWFEWCTLTVIALNAFWIAVDADHNDALTLREAQVPFQIADHTFCILFVAEWVIRFLGLQRKRDALYNRWFLFDTFLVIMMVTETWLLTAFTAVFERDIHQTLRSTFVLRVIRLFRIMRLTRMLRLMRACPELIFLVRGMLAATRSVVITMVLLFCILYAFGVAFRQLAMGTDMGEQYFGSVLQSMYTLLMAGTLLDNVGTTVANIASESTMCAMLFFAVILLAALTVMNMLIGVTCEVVSNVASSEREKAASQYAKEQVYNMLWNNAETQQEIDKDQDFKISKEDFRRLVYSDKACQTLKKVGVDVAAMVDLAELIFHRDSPDQDFPKLEFGEFMDIVLQLRGDNQTTVKDLVDMRRYLHLDNVSRNNDVVKVQERQLAMEMKLDSLERKIDKLLNSGKDKDSTCLSRRNSSDSIMPGSPRAMSPRGVQPPHKEKDSCLSRRNSADSIMPVGTRAISPRGLQPLPHTPHHRVEHTSPQVPTNTTSPTKATVMSFSQFKRQVSPGEASMVSAASVRHKPLTPPQSAQDPTATRLGDLRPPTLVEEQGPHPQLGSTGSPETEAPEEGSRESTATSKLTAAAEPSKEEEGSRRSTATSKLTAAAEPSREEGASQLSQESPWSTEHTWDDHP